MSRQKTISVPIEYPGGRLDAFLAAGEHLTSRSLAQRLIGEGAVLVDSREVKKNHRLEGGEEILLTLPDPVELEEKPVDIPLDIVFEDEHLLVVNKPQGMVVHPSAGHSGDTLVNALLHHCGDSLSGINGVVRPGIVHRIDKDTSGLLIVAKSDAAHVGLAAQIKEHSFGREYQALVNGGVKENRFTVDRPIGRSPSNRKKMAVTEQNSRQAVTHFEVLQRFQGYTHLRCRLETGRTHQIRVHLASIGHPVTGDPLYGGRNPLGLSTQCLHACHISFIHPITGETLSFESALPDYFKALLERLKPFE